MTPADGPGRLVAVYHLQVRRPVNAQPVRTNASAYNLASLALISHLSVNHTVTCLPAKSSFTAAYSGRAQSSSSSEVLMAHAYLGTLYTRMPVCAVLQQVPHGRLSILPLRPVFFA